MTRESEEPKRMTEEHKLNPTEAIFGFAAWLTCRQERTVMSASDNASGIARLIKEFCEANNLPKVSKQWPDHLVHPR
jgi:hypothetical protein